MLRLINQRHIHYKTHFIAASMWAKLQALSSSRVSLANQPPEDWLDTMLRIANVHIKDCSKNCEICPRRRRGLSSMKLPTRVINVGRADGSQPPFLYVPPREHDHPYLALSYCWGDQGNILTTPGNLSERVKEIPWSEIPLTIRDAILVTRKLGMC